MYSENDLKLVKPNLTEKGKLSRHSIFRLGMSFNRALIEKEIKDHIQRVPQNVMTTDKKYHIHYGLSSSDPKPNQMILSVDYKKGKNALWVTYSPAGKSKIQFKLYPNIVSNSITNEEQGKFDKIIKKVQQNKLLSSNEDTFIFEQINAVRNMGYRNGETVEQAKHPLLKTMDEYIASMEHKRYAEHVNDDMARDKIYFTEVLRTFVENATQENWNEVRKAMVKHPRFAFSWTGSSQVDMFLSMVKIQHQKNIQEWDDQYLLSNPSEPNTSWGIFLRTGWINYVLSSFLAPYKLASFLMKAYQRATLEDELVHIFLAINTGDSPFCTKAQELTRCLKIYLSESDEITEDTLTYMDEFEDHLGDLEKKINKDGKNQAVYAAIKGLHPHITDLVDRPVPSVKLTPA